MLKPSCKRLEKYEDFRWMSTDTTWLFFDLRGLDITKKNLNRIKLAIERPFYICFDFYRTAINKKTTILYVNNPLIPLLQLWQMTIN